MTESIQSHPLHAIDREHVDRWLARLLIRDEDFPESDDLQRDVDRLLTLSSLTERS